MSWVRQASLLQQLNSTERRRGMKLVELPYIYSTLAFVASIVMVIVFVYYLTKKK